MYLVADKNPTLTPTPSHLILPDPEASGGGGWLGGLFSPRSTAPSHSRRGSPLITSATATASTLKEKENAAEKLLL